MSDEPPKSPPKRPRKSRAKTPQVTPQVGPRLTLKQSQTAIEFLVKPDSLKQKGAWGREMKTLKQLFPLYPEAAFWTSIDFTFMLNSLLYFKSAEGAQELKRQWGLYQLTRPREVAPRKVPDFALDSETNPSTLVEESTPPARVQNAVDWASS